MNTGGSEHQRQPVPPQQGREGSIAHVQTSGQGAERRQNDPLAVGGETTATDAAATGAYAGAGVQVAGDLAK